MKIQSIGRFRAWLLHCLLSLVFFSGILWVLVAYWYPVPYFDISGGWQGVKIVAGIDVVLGPLLTFIVFNPKKPAKELIADISLIGAMQMIALCWGVYALHGERPAAVVFWDNSFLTVPAKALFEQNYELANMALLSDEKPSLVYAEPPANQADRRKLLDLITNQKQPPHHQPWLYRPLKDHFSEIKPQQVNIDEVLVKNPDVKNQLLPILQKNNKNTHDVFYFLLQSKYRNGLLIFDADAQYLGGVTLD